MLPQWVWIKIVEFLAESFHIVHYVNKMAYTAKDPWPNQGVFLYLTETKSWRCEGEEGETEENVHLLTHATARGVG